VRVNLTKKDLECIYTGCTGHYLEPPDEFCHPDEHKEYNQWQKTCYKITDALAEMEKGK
tara:strand:+ start:441 stop:617 length:177 start_codon:yes stop_codon:yes gene_type:complete